MTRKVVNNKCTIMKQIVGYTNLIQVEQVDVYGKTFCHAIYWFNLPVLTCRSVYQTNSVSLLLDSLSGANSCHKVSHCLHRYAFTCTPLLNIAKTLTKDTTLGKNLCAMKDSKPILVLKRPFWANGVNARLTFGGVVVLILFCVQIGIVEKYIFYILNSQWSFDKIRQNKISL